MLRRAVDGDIDQIVGMESRCFDSAKYALMSRRQFKKHIRSSNAVFFVHQNKEGIIDGYALALAHKRREDLRFYSLAVDSESRGGDVGKILFDAVIEYASNAGLNVQCEIRRDNEKLRRRYMSLGFNLYKTVEGYYPDGESCEKYRKLNNIIRK